MFSLGGSSLILVLIYGNISVRTAGHSFGHGKSFCVSAIVLHILYVGCICSQCTFNFGSK
ncbi:zinc finger mynd domain-containing protein [Moniliophthora roreri]|nr:zinc finger mynd domain-containing protein [Moniliophthora roreri]